MKQSPSEYNNQLRNLPVCEPSKFKDFTSFHIKYGPAKINPKNIKIGQDDDLAFSFENNACGTSISFSWNRSAASHHSDSTVSGLILDIPEIELILHYKPLPQDMHVNSGKFKALYTYLLSTLFDAKPT